MQPTINVIIIEDEKAAINRLKRELEKIETLTFNILDTFNSVSESISYFQNAPQADLVFMDIHLTDGLSLEIFRKVDLNTPVIFTTAYDQYALEAFKVNGIDYLLKPIEPQELNLSIQKFREREKSDNSAILDQVLRLADSLKPAQYRSSFLVSYRQKMLMINIKEVAFFYIKEKAVFLKQTDGKEFLVDFILDELETQLDPKDFYRANRQFLVARSAIKEIEPYFNGRLVLMVNPTSTTPVIVSKEKASNFKKWANY